MKDPYNPTFFPGSPLVGPGFQTEESWFASHVFGALIHTQMQNVQLEQEAHPVFTDTRMNNNQILTDTRMNNLRYTHIEDQLCRNNICSNTRPLEAFLTKPTDSTATDPQNDMVKDPTSAVLIDKNGIGYVVKIDTNNKIILYTNTGVGVLFSSVDAKEAILTDSYFATPAGFLVLSDKLVLMQNKEGVKARINEKDMLEATKLGWMNPAHGAEKSMGYREFKVGDRVYDERVGEGTVVAVGPVGGLRPNPVEVLFSASRFGFELQSWYTLDGRFYEYDKRPSLHHVNTTPLVQCHVEKVPLVQCHVDKISLLQYILNYILSFFRRVPTKNTEPIENKPEASAIVEEISEEVAPTNLDVLVAYIEQIKQTCEIKPLPDIMQDNVQKVLDKAAKIVESIRTKDCSISIGECCLSRYLPALLNMLQTYQNLPEFVQREKSAPKNNGLLTRCLALLEDTHTAMYAQNEMEAQADLNVLDNLLKMQGK